MMERWGDNLLRSQHLRGVARLVVDATGVGRPVVDLLKKANLYLEAVTITAGDNVTTEGGHVGRTQARSGVNAAGQAASQAHRDCAGATSAARWCA
ncbi:MAG: hypothetical protein M3R24_08350 [Chloroflexota bacterium]|nr:hypothetical protein [Chloroflexota bacterium]